ncbi:AAA family ATPase [Rhodopseudomonas palustris]|uniref:AAA family ATPase n=1 Tax=Thiospirillum jenense TaxID=1653858 RepID=A0A839HK77_9GAMM|nr:AAA family ATPase [Thiospirillum jenense]MBB1091990.1 AAA family ATPase [Rhodopseudomonas palustris]MBB1126292.1 AAA family ATPase [Thiospirillum jenense]
MKTITIFNNKGGVGKTTYMFHVAHLLARKNKTVLMVDCDSQCNLTAYAMRDEAIEKAWNEDGNSIYRVIELVYRGIGDIRKTRPTPLSEHLYIVPGDLFLSNYEDKLGDSWNSAKGGSEPDLRVQSAIYRYIKWVASEINADVVMIDLGPNLGALNRAVLSSSDYFIVPVAPDLFSIKGTENLGSKLVTWQREWQQCNNAWAGDNLDLPQGKPIFAGYVIQQHNPRNNAAGMTKGWQIFGDQLENAMQQNIIGKLSSSQIISWADGSYNLGKIPNLHSLIPYSLNARKPVFDCNNADGLTGAHITTAKKSVDHFNAMVERLLELIN